jgi:hypothetical protein
MYEKYKAPSNEANGLERLIVAVLTLGLSVKCKGP